MTDAMHDRRPDRLGRCRARHALLALGWACVGLGAVGIVVPGLPTTVFLLVALWAFSRSSERFHRWLYHHPTLGPPIRAWHEHRVIPARAKALAVATMAASVGWVTIAFAANWLVPAALAAGLAPVALFILTRRSRPAS